MPRKECPIGVRRHDRCPGTMFGQGNEVVRGEGRDANGRSDATAWKGRTWSMKSQGRRNVLYGP